MEVISKGDWKVIKGRLMQMYAQLTDNDLIYIVGKEQELLGRIQRKLGKSKEEVLLLIKSIKEDIS